MIDVIQRSTIHGVNHMYSSTSKISKLFWLILLLCGLVGICVTTSFIVVKYLSKPISMRQFWDYEAFIWPNLVFCVPQSPVKIDRDSPTSQYWNETINKYKGTIEYLHHRMKGKSPTIKDYIEKATLMSSIEPMKLQTDNYSNLIKKVKIFRSYSTKRFFGDSMNFEYRTFRDLNSIFTSCWYPIPYNIPCHTFNFDKAKHIKKSNIQAIEFHLALNHDSYKLFNAVSKIRSVHLYLNYKNEISERSIILTPGTRTELKISESRYLYSGIQRKCRNNVFTVQLYDALIQSTDTFEGNANLCSSIESQKWYVHKCGCYNPFLPIYKNESGFPRICLNASIFTKFEMARNLNCLLNNTSKFWKSYPRTCNKYRTVKCDIIRYKTDVRGVMFSEIWWNSVNNKQRQYFKQIHDSYFGKIERNENFLRVLRDNLIILNIERESYYGDLYQEEGNFGITDLLSSIGGLMGLWMGVSVVGLFEIVQYFYYIIKSCCPNKISQK